MMLRLVMMDEPAGTGSVAIIEDGKTDFRFAVRGLRCDSVKPSGAEPQAKGESVQ